MAKEKKPVHKVQMTDGKRQIIQQLLQEYDIETAEDIQDALKDLLGGTIKEMMEAEMDDHLGYQKSERYDSDDYRNGYKTKRVNSSFGSLDIQVPQDRKSSFEPQVVKKRQKDISTSTSLLCALGKTIETSPRTWRIIRSTTLSRPSKGSGKTLVRFYIKSPPYSLEKQVSLTC